MPIYITATALGKLAHPEGEVVLARAAATQGVIQMCPTLASCSLDEMISAKTPTQVQWFQLYVNRNRKVQLPATPMTPNVVPYRSLQILCVVQSKAASRLCALLWMHHSSVAARKT